MIYGIQYSPNIKRAFGDKGFSSTAARVAEQIHLDPAVSSIDVLVIGPRDISGIAGQPLVNAINNKHKDVKIVYIYAKEKEYVEFDSEVTAVKLKRVTPDAIKEEVTDIISSENIRIKDTNIISNDAINKTEESEPKRRFSFPNIGKKKSADPVEEEETTYEEETEMVEEEQQEELTLPSEEPELELLEEKEDNRPPNLTVSDVIHYEDLPNTRASMEERISNVKNFTDWEVFKHSLDKDAIMRDLLGESAQLSGALNMLEVLDKQIQNTFTDVTTTHEEKLLKIRNIALERSAYKDIENNIIVQKLGNIMSAIVVAAEASVEKRLDFIRNNLDEVAKVQIYHSDTVRIQKLIEERLELQVELHELGAGIISLYQAMDQTVVETIKGFDANIPSSNAYINEVLKPVRPIFTPASVSTLANKLLTDLSEHRVAMSAIESNIQQVISLLFKLYELDSSIIEHQSHLINLLHAQRVEDVVITDTMIKSSLRVFVGIENVGLRSTALTWSGILSRRRNTLLIDLTGNAKFGEYGMESESLETFLNTKIEKPLVCVEGDIKDATHLKEVINKLTERVNYYPHINIVVDASQEEYLHILAESAVCVHFISNSSKQSIRRIGELSSNFTIQNVARKVVLIDPAMEPLWLMEQLNFDPLITKLIQIPHLSKMRSYELRAVPPFKDSEIIDIFEMAFR